MDSFEANLFNILEDAGRLRWLFGKDEERILMVFRSIPSGVSVDFIRAKIDYLIADSETEEP